MDRERAIRRYRDAQKAGVRLAKATRTHDLQDAWEHWTIMWRIAVDMLEGYGKRNATIRDALSELQTLRNCDEALIYVWACGNAERHNPDGSAQARRGFAINAADRTKPLFIERMIYDQGRIIHLSGTNMSLNNDVGTLELRPVPVDRKKVATPPQDANQHKLLNRGDEYLNRLKTLVVPKF